MLLSSVFVAVAPTIWTILTLAAAVGAIALASPRLFAKLAAFGNRWIDTSSLLAKLDKRVDVDEHLMPYSRILGAVVIASVGLLMFVLNGR